MKSIHTVIRSIVTILAVCAVLAGAALVHGCKDEIVPAAGAVQKRSLTVLAHEYNPATGQYDLPAVGAAVTVYQVTASGEKELTAMTTDADGIARYQDVFPTAGLNVRVQGVYKNQVQTANPRVFLFCQDLTVALNFESEPVRDVCCPPPGDTLTAVFIDERGSTDLIQNTPAGIASYDLTRTLFRNGCPATAITVEVPSVPAPFSIRQLRTSAPVTTVPVVVQPGETFSATFSVSTRTIGHFTADVVFTLVCSDGSRAPVLVRLAADVVALPCDCGRDSVINVYAVTEPIPVGSTRRIWPLKVLDVPQDCGAITITRVNSASLAGSAWQLGLPNLPVTLQPGSAFEISATYAPYRTDSATASFTFEYTLVNGTRCSKIVRLHGMACRDMCPLLLDPKPARQFDPLRPYAFSFSQAKGYVTFSGETSCEGTTNVQQKSFALLLPDSACCAGGMQFSVSVVDPEASRVSADFFTVSPRSAITLARGVRTSIDVSFRAPTISEFAAIFQSGRRKATGAQSDSTFHIRIHLQGTTCRDCEQWIDVYAIVSPFMQISPIRSLHAYGQHTDLMPVPPTEVSAIESYVNGELSPGLVDQLIRVDRTYPYPPDQFDFFVEVRDTSSAAAPLPAKPPMLFRTAPSRYTKIQRVASGYLERDFEQIVPVVSRLQNDFTASGTYFTRASLPFTFPGNPATAIFPQPGDVYVIYEDSYWLSTRGTSVPCHVALLFVRSVFTGQENNTNHQSGIEFRLLYPVVLY